MKYIILTGKLGVGKDFIGDSLKYEMEKRNYKVLKTAFADELKEDVSLLYNRNLNEYYGDKTHERRRELINHGQNMKNVFGNNYWALRLVYRLKKIKNYDYFIITDMRFLSEYETLSKHVGRENIFISKIVSDKFHLRKIENEIGFSEEKLRFVEDNESEIENIPYDFIYENTIYMNFDIGRLLFRIFGYKSDLV